jgi:dUTP pyrophosphatase
VRYNCQLSIIVLRRITDLLFQKYTIPIQYHADIIPIEQKDNSDWIDLRSAENVTLFQNQHSIISLGVSMELPDGFEAIIAPRSSTFIRYGVLQTNGIGVIDNSYCGPDDIWMFPAFATRYTFIEKNARICQFRIQQKQPRIVLVQRQLSNANRGGLGSTGEI